MRIAIGGIMHESNTFASKPTDAELFRAGGTTYGSALIPVWADAHHEMGGFIEGAMRYHYEAVPTAMGWATPAGPVTDEFFNHFVDAIITNAKLAKPDGVLLALHGAMVTPKHPDADAEVCRRVRAAMGPEMPIAVSLDFHGNPTPEMGETANIIVGYQTYPHIDQRARGLLAAELLTRAIKKEIRPVTYVAKPPLIINLLGQATDRDPMKSLMRLARTLENQPGMLSVSVMAGFPYADVPGMGPSVLAVADGDPEKAKQAAEQVAAEMWDVRHELYVPCPQPEEAVNRAIAADRCPVLLIDLGDNVGGGSAGDGTVLLAELLRQKARGFVVPMYAPHAVEAAKKAGIDGTVEVTVGGLSMALRNFMGAVNRPQPGLWITLVAIPANTLLAYALIYGHFGLPRLDLLGAGLATTFVNVLMCAVAIWVCYARRPFRKYQVLGRFWRFDWILMKQLIIVGAPMSGSFLLEYGVFAAAAQLMGWIGTAALAAHQIALQIASVMFMVPFGISMAATVRVGHAAGRGDAAATRRAGFTAVALGVVFMAAMTLLVVLTRDILPLAFLGREAPDPQTVAIASSLLLVGACFFIADGVQTIAAGSLRGLNDTRVPLAFAAVSFWLVGFSGCWVFGFTLGLGAYGIWIGLSVGIILYALLLIWRFQRLTARHYLPTIMSAAPL